MERVDGQAWAEPVGAGKRKKIKDAALLAMLTPSSVTGSSVQATNKARRDWLRNCRWLYANSLALLVDNSKSEQRQQIYADILGLGHISSTLNNLKEYRSELPKTHGLQKKVEDIANEIQVLEVRLSHSTSARQRVASRLHAILTTLPGAPSSSDNFTQNLQNAQFIVAKLVHSNTKSRNILLQLRENWNEYELIKQQQDKSRNALAQLTQASVKITEEHRVLAKKLSTIDATLAAAKLGMDWAKKNTDVLEGWIQFTNNPIIRTSFPTGQMSFQDFSERFTEYDWSDDRQQHWRESLKYLISISIKLLNAVKTKSDLVGNPVFPPVDLVQKIGSASAAAQTRITAQTEFDAVSNVLNRLRALGRDALHTFKSSHCPLCDHDWQSGDALAEQLSSNDLSPELQAVSRKLADAQREEKNCLATLEAANLQKASFDAYSSRVQAVINELQAIEDKTSYLKIMRRAEFLEGDIQHFPQLLSRLQAVTRAKELALTVHAVEKFLNIATDHDASVAVANALKNLKLYCDHFQHQHDSENENRLHTVRLLSEKLENMQAKAHESHLINASIAAASQTVDRFHEQWQKVCGSQPISKELHAMTQAKVDTELKVAENIHTELQEFQLFLSVDADSERLASLTRQGHALDKKLTEGNTRIHIADQAISRYSEYVRDETVSSLAPLLEPATELFSRMHANEVYQQLSVSVEDLNWHVLADDHDLPLEAQEKLSQGQRQDLALSLYLARAKNTGGSFLLDEPIAHLDDLNRVAMLDIFRLVATSIPHVNIILTTASDSLARHMTQKFSSITDRGLLNTIYLEGNPRLGVKATVTGNVAM